MHNNPDVLAPWALQSWKSSEGGGGGGRTFGRRWRTFGTRLRLKPVRPMSSKTLATPFHVRNDQSRASGDAHFSRTIAPPLQWAGSEGGVDSAPPVRHKSAASALLYLLRCADCWRKCLRLRFHALRLAASTDGRKREKKERQNIRGKDGVQGGEDMWMEQRERQEKRDGCKITAAFRAGWGRGLCSGGRSQRAPRNITKPRKRQNSTHHQSDEGVCVQISI